MFLKLDKNQKILTRKHIVQSVLFQTLILAKINKYLGLLKFEEKYKTTGLKFW